MRQFRECGFCKLSLQTHLCGRCAHNQSAIEERDQAIAELTADNKRLRHYEQGIVEALRGTGDDPEGTEPVIREAAEMSDHEAEPTHIIRTDMYNCMQAAEAAGGDKAEHQTAKLTLPKTADGVAVNIQDRLWIPASCLSRRMREYCGARCVSGVVSRNWEAVVIDLGQQIDSEYEISECYSTLEALIAAEAAGGE